MCALAARRSGTTLKAVARAHSFVSANSGEELAEVVGELGITVAVGIVMDPLDAEQDEYLAELLEGE